MNKKIDDASVSNMIGEEAQVEPFQQNSRLCLFFEAKDKDDYQKILSFVSTVKSKVHRVEAVTFYHGKMPETLLKHNELYFFGKKDFNLFKQKKKSLKEWLATHEYDVLICFAGDNREKNEKIIKDVKSKLKVGPNFAGPGKHFQISIGKPGERMDFNEFYKQVKHYISQFNIN